LTIDDCFVFGKLEVLNRVLKLGELTKLDEITILDDISTKCTLEDNAVLEVKLLRTAGDDGCEDKTLAVDAGKPLDEFLKPEKVSEDIVWNALDDSWSDDEGPDSDIIDLDE
jgi:hypothetical protein